nr:immunoglobulin heavy chain junction region [Mus musculus]
CAIYYDYDWFAYW